MHLCARLFYCNYPGAQLIEIRHTKVRHFRMLCWRNVSYFRHLTIVLTSQTSFDRKSGPEPTTIARGKTVLECRVQECVLYPHPLRDHVCGRLLATSSAPPVWHAHTYGYPRQSRLPMPCDAPQHTLHHSISYHSVCHHRRDGTLCTFGPNFICAG